MSDNAPLLGLLPPDQENGPVVGDVVTGEDGHRYRVVAMEEFGGTGHYVYTLERADDERPAR